MPVIPINRVGDIGIVRDVAAHSLPLNAWSGGQNVRFIDGAAEKMLGHAQQFGLPQVNPFAVLPIPTPTDGLFFWMYLGLTGVSVVDQASLHTDLTRATGGPYAASAVNRWNGGVFGGIPVVNNGVDDPQMWSPLSIGQKLQLMSNWPANTKCRTLRPFKRFLIALDVTKSATRFPRLVKWSHIANVGALPSSWDETNETLDAGEHELSETGDAVVDAVPLGDVMLLYKENSVWGMQYIGGVFVFRFYEVFIGGVGILNTDWAMQIPGGRHVVFTGDDLVIHTGVPKSQVASIIQGRWREWLRANLSSTNFKRSFVVPNFLKNEGWLCFPSTGATAPDKALIWNWVTNSVTLRDLPGVAHGAYSINRDLSSRRLLLADVTNQRLQYADETNQFNGVNMTATLERTDLGIPLKTGEPPDLTTDKFYRRLWPRITGTGGGIINVYDAVTNIAGVAPVYGAAKTYTIGVTEFLDINKTGKLLNLKFESTTDISWKMHGYEVDVDAAKKQHG